MRTPPIVVSVRPRKGARGPLSAVFDWINWYNHERLHTSLQMQSPHEFEQTLTGQLLAA